MSLGNRLITPLLCICSTWLYLGPPSAEAREVDPGEVLRVWHDREQSISSAEVKWDDQVFYPKGSQISLRKRSHPTPKEDTTVRRSCSLGLLGDDCVRYSRVGRALRFAMGEFEETHFEKVYSGGKVFTFSHRLSEKLDTHPVGTVGPRPDVASRESISSIALISLLRPSCQVLQILDPNSTQTAEPGVFEGQAVIVLKCKSDSNAMSYHYVVDPSNDFRPLAISLHANGRLFKEIVFQYESNRNELFGLSGWTTRKLNPKERLAEEGSCTISSLRLNPKDLGEDRFAYTFPPGTEVGDYTVDPPRAFIAREGGRIRPVTRAENVARVPYEKLLSTDGPSETLGQLRE